MTPNSSSPLPRPVQTSRGPPGRGPSLAFETAREHAFLQHAVVNEERDLLVVVQLEYELPFDFGRTRLRRRGGCLGLLVAIGYVRHDLSRRSVQPTPRYARQLLCLGNLRARAARRRSRRKMQR